MFSSLADEWLLLAAILGLYAWDRVWRLHANEWVLSGQAPRWRGHVQGAYWQWRGLALLIPRPLRPDVPLLRMTWHADGAAPASTMPDLETARDRLMRLRWLRWCVWPLALGLLAMPFVIRFAPQREWALLICLLLVFGSVLSMLAGVWRQRAVWGLSTRAWATLAFELLVCPPFAVNIIGKLSGAIPIRGDSLAFAAQALPRADWLKLRRSVLRQVGDEMMGVDENSERHQALQRWRERFVSRYPDAAAEA